MYVILSQKIDTVSSYGDELFKLYHYPARYKNLLNTGDIFIYYQGNRQNKDHRYYFGVGTIGKIYTPDNENYYADLINCKQFEKQVPIYLPNGGYIEQLGYETIRNSINPPWQSSIRPISQQAFDYILNVSGLQLDVDDTGSIEKLNESLKKEIRNYFVGNDKTAIYRIKSISSKLSSELSIANSTYDDTLSNYSANIKSSEKIRTLIDYCKNMKMSYSYKAVLILALMEVGTDNDEITIDKTVRFFRKFYDNRKHQGLKAEIKQCIYLKDDVSDEQIKANIIANPIKALCKTGLFFFNENTQKFILSPEISANLTGYEKGHIKKICKRRLKEYYQE